MSRTTGTKSKREARRIAEGFEAEENGHKDGAGRLSAAYEKVLQRVVRDAEAGDLKLADAETYIREIHKLADPDFREVTLADFWEQWITEQEPHVVGSTLNGYQQDKALLADALGPKVMSRPISDLTSKGISKALMDASSGSRKAATVNKALASLRRLLESALAKGLVTHNAAKAVRSLKTTDSVTRAPFTEEEIAQLVGHASTSEEWRGMILLAVHTGLRMGDVARVTSEDIKGGVATVMPEKTARSKKVITIPLSQPCLDWVAGREGPLFPTIRHQRKGTTSAQFTAIMTKAGVPKRVRLAGGIEATRSFHSLRHTFTSWLADAGVPSEVRQRLTGHSSSRIHQKYTHLDSALTDAVDKLPAI
ncbi:MAG: site-specific integrase [Roseibacillus sp.]|nr:site-specific integrase [Roseibacillus sp.]